LIGVALGIALCAWLAHSLDWNQLRAVFASADWRLVLAAALLNLIPNTTARVFRFRALLSRIPSSRRPIGTFELTRVVLGTRALSLLLPARAGELWRLSRLHRRHGYGVGGVLSVVLLESVVEAVSLLVPALFLLPLVPLFGWTRGARPVAIALLALSVMTVLWLNRRRSPQRSSKIAKLLQSVRALGSPGTWARALAWSWISDATDVAMIALSARAAGLVLDVPGAFAVLIAVNLACLLPAAPAQIGTLEAGAVLVLQALGAGQDQAVAIALLYHAAHLLPIAVAGGLSLAWPQEAVSLDPWSSIDDISPSLSSVRSSR
jgi:uncharacterized membrane protein YbhN (UPF0104 family)